MLDVVMLTVAWLAALHSTRLTLLVPALFYACVRVPLCAVLTSVACLWVADTAQECGNHVIHELGLPRACVLTCHIPLRQDPQRRSRGVR